MLVELEPGDLIEPMTGRLWSRAEIRGRCARRVALLKAHGVGGGDRVFLHEVNTLEVFVDLIAIWSIGACVVPIDPRLTPFEIEMLAAAARPKLSLWAERAEARGDGAARDVGASRLGLDQEALILFTSGTTGQPKGVVHTHRSLRARWTSLRQTHDLSRFRRSLCLLPTHFGHGLICNALFPWLSGQDLFVLPPFRADVVAQLGALIDTHGITFMSSVPTLWRLALKTARPPTKGTLQQVHCGSAPLSADLWRKVREWSGTANVQNAYGITETGSWVAGTDIQGVEVEDGLIGRPWGAVIAVMKSGTTDVPLADLQRCAHSEEGHVWINTPGLMRGYLDREDLTQAVVSQGWFSTGDIGCIDERGLLFLRGRERDEINKGGMKVHPGDIDAVLERFEGCDDVCAFGFEDALYGEDVGVAIVLQDPGALSRLREWARVHLAGHQVPRRWYLVPELPRSSRGKLRRARVADACRDLAPVEP